jgi:hypothetical protein
VSNIRSFSAYFRAAATVAAITGGMIGTSTTMARALTVEEALSDVKFCWQIEDSDPQKKSLFDLNGLPLAQR